MAEQTFSLRVAGNLSEITQEQRIMLVRSLLTSLGKLKFRHKGLLDCLCANMASEINEECPEASLLKNKDMAAFLLTTATLNYCPQTSDKLYEVRI